MATAILETLLDLLDELGPKVTRQFVIIEPDGTRREIFVGLDGSTNRDP